MSRRDRQAPLLDAVVRLDGLPAEGRVLEVETTPEQRDAIAQRLKVTAVDALSANLTATLLRGGIRLRGRLTAEIRQPCVVSFVPVTQRIDEPVDRVFLPGREGVYDGPAGSETYVDLEGEDLPDYFEGPEVDFTELILEVMALAIDPYPRAPGAELPPEAVDDEPGKASPFAGLSKLKSTGD